MKKSYTDVNVLLQDLKIDIKDTLTKEVMDEVKNIELRHIESDVLSIYSPKIYQRRAHGGIDDEQNIVGEVIDMHLVVDNVTSFNSDYGTYNSGAGLADLINDGESRHGFYYDYDGEFTQPRPFIDNTIEEIEHTDSVENALKRGLKRNGYDVK